ncbi:hypothetical protein L7F22_062050 [Adiantum nelumboides]|nr:hypothetical protein [Adiantum nelumboides]
MSGEDEGRQPPQHPYWTRLRQSFGQGGESSSAIEEEEEANQPTPKSQYSSSSSDTEYFEQVPEEVPNLELHRAERRYGSLEKRRRSSKKEDSDSESDEEDEESDDSSIEDDSESEKDSDEEDEDWSEKKKKKKKDKHKKKKTSKKEQKRDKKGKSREASGSGKEDISQLIATQLKALGLTKVGMPERPYCQTCQVFGHSSERCWYNPNFRGRIPERMQQRGNAHGVDAVIPGGNQVRQSNYRNWNNQGPNQRLQAQAAGWNNQRNQDRNGGNHPCTYCGISGHRQGPECPLWCKHRSERGMPIVQYNNRGNQPQQRPPAQLNAVILEEVEPEQPEDYLKTIQQESDDILRADKDCCSKGKTMPQKVCKEDVEISNIELGVFKVIIRVGEAVRFRMQTKYSQKEYRLDILRVSERKSSEEVMQKRSKTIAGEKTPVKESLGSKELAAEQDAMGNRRGRSSTKQSLTVLVDDDDDHEDMGFQPSPVATKGRTTTEHNFLEFKVEIDPLQANNARWLKKIGLLDYALLPWTHWRFTTQTGMIMAQLLEFNGLVGHGVYLSASLVAKVFDLPEGLDNTVDKASEEDMDGEFGKGEGSRNYFILKNVQNQERLQQIKWFLERVMLLIKLDYISRENYAILSWAEKGRRFGWATMLYERIHSEIFSKEKKRVQRSTKVGPLITAIYMHVRNNAVLRALNPSGSHQAADRQEEDIQEGCSQPIGVRKAAQEAKQKMLDQQGGAAELYRSLLSAGYSHEECMETVGLDKSVELPKFWGETSVPTREFKTPITVSTVKKPIRLRKRKVESVAGVLEASSLIKEYMDQQHLNNAVLVNGNSKLKAENEELKKNLETNLLNRAEIEGLQEQIRLLTGKLQAKEEKLDFYQKQLSRRVSTAQMYKEWQEEWSAILNKELDMLFATNARLEADNKVLLNRVIACKEVEEKIRDCTDEELVIDGWYLPAQEVDDMKAELRRQGEQIWMNFGKKMEEVISKPYQIFAKEENSEELLLLQSQLEDLQGKFNFLQEQQSEKEHKKADDSQVDEEFNVKGKRSAVKKSCFDEEPVQQTGEEYESSDLDTLISNVDDKEQDEKQDDVVKEKDELLVDVQNIKEQETVAEQQQDVVMEAVGDEQAIQDVVLYEAEKKDAD